MAIGFNTNELVAEARLADLALGAIDEALSRPREPKLIYVGEQPCTEKGCDNGLVERDVETPNYALVTRLFHCSACNGTAKVICCHCMERVAVYEYHWFRTQPGYVGDAVDELCEECSKAPCYAGGAA